MSGDSPEICWIQWLRHCQRNMDTVATTPAIATTWADRASA